MWFFLGLMLVGVWLTANRRHLWAESVLRRFREANNAFVNWMEGHPDADPREHQRAQELLVELILAYRQVREMFPVLEDSGLCEFYEQYRSSWAWGP